MKPRSSDGQRSARRQEEGARPWQVQVSLPGFYIASQLNWCPIKLQEDVDDLETTDKFKLAVVQNKLLGPVIYRQPIESLPYMQMMT